MQAKDVMTTPVVTMQPEASVADIARLMLEHRISGIPVVDRDGRLVGIVSRANLLHGLAAGKQRASGSATSDRKLRAAVLKEIDRAGVDRSHVNAVVSDGVVELWGFVDTDVQRRALVVAARSVEGVKRVVDRSSVLPPLLRGAMGSQ